MDPYLERHLGDVQRSFITYATAQLNKILPRDLRARIGKRVFNYADVAGRPSVPDVRFFKRAVRACKVSATPAVAEPLIVPLDEPITETYFEIQDIRSRHLPVTVIEVLSRASKAPGQVQDDYLRKHQKLLASGGSLVEIDLLRCGNQLWPFPVDRLPTEHETPYGVCVTRGWQLREVEFYPISLREPLPTIRVPLRQSDADASLNLQQLIEQRYENGSHTDDIDYHVDLDPALPAAGALWADALLRKRGLRTPHGAPGRRGRRNGKR